MQMFRLSLTPCFSKVHPTEHPLSSACGGEGQGEEVPGRVTPRAPRSTVPYRPNRVRCHGSGQRETPGGISTRSLSLKGSFVGKHFPSPGGLLVIQPFNKTGHRLRSNVAHSFLSMGSIFIKDGGGGGLPVNPVLRSLRSNFPVAGNIKVQPLTQLLPLILRFPFPG